MRIFRACNQSGRAGQIWDKDYRIWWSSEWIGSRNAVILCRREDHVNVAIITAFQGGWDGTRVGFEFIFEMVECLICMFPADFSQGQVLEVGVFVVYGGG